MKKNANVANEVILNAALVDKTYKDADAMNAIKNADLRKHIEEYASAETSAQSSVWSMVKAIGQAAYCIKSDFGSDKSFADFMGLTQSAVNKQKRLSKYADECIARGLTASNAMELLPILGMIESRVHLDDRKATIDTVLDMVNARMTQKEIRAIVKNLFIDRDTQALVILDEKENQDETAASTDETAASMEETAAGKEETAVNADEKAVQKKGFYTIPVLYNGAVVPFTVKLKKVDAQKIAEFTTNVLGIAKED